MIKNRETLPLRCLVVDDEQIAIKVVESNIAKVDFLELTATASSAMEAAEILKKSEIDLMFLDINMPQLSGLDFLETLDKAPLTIITTAYSEYALEGYRLQVVDYLLKPIGFRRFFQAVQKARETFHSRLVVERQDESLPSDAYIRQGDTFERIEWREIAYVEGMQNYLKLHFAERLLVIHQTMTSLEEMLPSSHFYRIHRSYLVNVNHIEQIGAGYLTVKGAKLPIAKPRRAGLLESVVNQKLLSK